MRARAVALRGISRRGEGVRDPTHVRFCPKAPRSLLTRPDQATNNPVDGRSWHFATNSHFDCR
jgi:hypothetical protein